MPPLYHMETRPGAEGRSSGSARQAPGECQARQRRWRVRWSPSCPAGARHVPRAGERAEWADRPPGAGTPLREAGGAGTAAGACRWRRLKCRTRDAPAALGWLLARQPPPAPTPGAPLPPAPPGSTATGGGRAVCPPPESPPVSEPQRGARCPCSGRGDGPVMHPGTFPWAELPCRRGRGRGVTWLGRAGGCFSVCAMLPRRFPKR